MVQGNLKLKKKAPARVTKKQRNPKKAAPKIIKPKKATDSTKLAKVHSASSMKSTEKLVSSRVGHLELLHATKRENKDNDSKANK